MASLLSEPSTSIILCLYIFSISSRSRAISVVEVIICGKVVNYQGNTPETVANKSYIYSLNGKTE